MLFRFCLYGFLKNQRYFEPYLILAFLDRGLSFFTIGLLIGFREWTVAALEIPSGAIADSAGRRKSMLTSFTAYAISFILLGLAQGYAWLFLGMFFFAIGDSFRSGTHKAMIFTWLRDQGREDERTKIYGITRSWSKFGSAVSAILASAFVFITGRLDWIFFAAVIPCLFSIINILGYPQELDGESSGALSKERVLDRLRQTVSALKKPPPLRRLVYETMGFEGFFLAVKDYLQPVLKLVAIAWLVRWIPVQGLTEVQKTALLIAPIYTLIHLLSGFASRRADPFAKWAGGEEKASLSLWVLVSALYLGMAGAAFWGGEWALVLTFMLLPIVQNLWRPVLISRFDHHTQESNGATVLSVESQAKRIAAFVIAPLLGGLIDATTSNLLGSTPFWPIGLLGFVISALFAFAVAAKSRAHHPA